MTYTVFNDNADGSLSLFQGAYSWHHKSAYTMLRFCAFEQGCASQTDI